MNPTNLKEAVGHLIGEPPDDELVTHIHASHKMLKELLAQPFHDFELCEFCAESKKIIEANLE